MRKFVKISYEQFCKDICADEILYGEYLLPVRKTTCSAGYDFFNLYGFILMPGESKKIPTGIKVQMGSDEMLMLIIRSGVGFKYSVGLTNQVGIIESDYYDNIDNEGHMWVSVKNNGDKIFEIKKGDSFFQGIFNKFLIVDEEEIIATKRKGGFGSTNKGEK